MTSLAAPRNCFTCDEASCAMNRRHGVVEPPPARTSFVLDDCWPEYASILAATRRPDDQVLAPGLWRGWPSRYSWTGEIQRPALLATARRHLEMRMVAR